MSVFHFKHFSIQQSNAAMKVGTDAMILGASIISSGKKKGLDVGAGTGVLSLMVAQGNNELKIDAIEIDELAAKECEFNFKASKWWEALSIHTGDFLQFTPEGEYDLIFSNPPYYQSTLLNEDARKSTARHEQSLPIPSFLEKVSSLLAPEGSFWLIVPFADQFSWEQNGAMNGLYVRTQINIHGKQDDEPKRVIVQFERKTDELKIGSLVIRELNGAYSNAYVELTKEFHGKKV